MSLNKKLSEHFEAFPQKEILKKTTIFALSKDGRVYGQLGKKRDEKDVQSLGALLVGLWQASEAVEGFLDENSSGEMALSYQDSARGFYILRPNKNNPDVFWGLLFEGVVNPGKIKVYFKGLREHFNQIKILDKKELESNGNGSTLFQDITDEEVDQLFSFAGL
jgi:hypothetical protein